MAPGRINIIGEHTDYAGGLSLPAAVDRYVAVAASRASLVEVASDQFGRAAPVDLDALRPTGEWVDLLLGVVAELKLAGVNPGLRLAVVSSVPPGSGLSSSAAVGVAAALAALELDGQAMEGLEVARLCRRAENDFLGVPSGLMDQVASTMGRRDTALFFNAAAELAEPVDLPADFAWLVIQSGIPRSLRGSGYTDRPAEAAEALHLARQLRRGLRTLAELEPAELEAMELPEPYNRRARHVVGESLRVRLAIACLEAANLAALGELMVTSHRSLARDCEVSLPELDAIVEVALDVGCAGARLMGAGFGGSVLAVVAADEADAVADRIRSAWRAAARGGGQVHHVAVVDGAMAR